MARLLLIAHDHVSAGGAVEARFEERGYEIDRQLVVPEDRFDNPGVEFAFPDPRDYEAVLVLGALWGVYYEEVASWVKPELEMLAQADEAGVPVFGICFGGQMLAQAHGGEVGPSPISEIGPHVVSGIPEVAGIWMQWHHDRFVAPADATVVGQNAAATQAFVLRRNLAVQFHPEVDADGLAGWLANGGAESAVSRGLDPEVLLDHVRSLDPEVRPRAAALVDYFLDEVAPR